MPLIYVSKKTDDLVKRIVEHLHMNKNKDTPECMLKTDVIKVAVEENARKMR